MAFIIGVDGGGTKTEAAAYHMGGNKLAEGRSSYGNVLINRKGAVRHIIAAINQCVNQLLLEECRFIYIGLAGLGGVEDPDSISREIQELFRVPTKVVNDGVIAHAAMLKGKDGILTISGTGSVSIGRSKGVYHLAGGWGHLLGDEGSGYWIAMQAYKKVIQESERMQHYSQLSMSILDRHEIKEAEELKKFIYAATKGEIAALVPLIKNLAENGDEMAGSILHQAGVLLAEQTLLLWNKVGFQNYGTIAVKGSVLSKIPMVLSAFEEKCASIKKEAKFMVEDLSSTLGGFYLAMDEIK
ncbi:BadF/BadG/BcrA/BcrD ATPase family protein [Bacillus sp. 1P06AnD]|uniref:BadF/BadG/BcrA/BcrD ATPase family protein n=1 Tax=Bacillus sp. 1P06AnD TaxID=3132208 RepID=UPI0039A28CD5